MMDPQVLRPRGKEDNFRGIMIGTQTYFQFKKLHLNGHLELASMTYPAQLWDLFFG